MLTAFTLRIFVLHLCIFNPTREEMAASSLVFSCICWWLWDKSARSSAKSRSSSCVFSVHWIPFLLCFVHIFIIQSMTRRKRNGDSKQPCLTPVFTSKRFVNCPLCITLQPVPSELFLIKLTSLVGIP